MALMDLLRSFQTGTQQNQSNPNQQPGPNNQGTPGNIPVGMTQPGSTVTLADGTTAPNGTVPFDTNKKEVESPLDPFADLWKTDPNAKAADPEKLFDFSADALKKAAASQDFRSSITKEQLTAIAKGGQEAVEAFSIVMNSVAQDAYMRAAVASTKLIEAGIKKNNATLESKFQNQIRSSNFSESLKAENPAFSHPAAQPLISAVEAQMALKYPQATSAELRELATGYLDNFATAIKAPALKLETTKQQADETDWSTFLQ